VRGTGLGGNADRADLAAAICGSEVAMPSNISGIWPATTCTSAGGEPLNGTCCRSSPAFWFRIMPA
jgi:hypothetical protein